MTEIEDLHLKPAFIRIALNKDLLGLDLFILFMFGSVSARKWICRKLFRAPLTRPLPEKVNETPGMKTRSNQLFTTAGKRSLISG
tara:strand:- start:2524 stop:2778 length:255 start_codon:yes stop_codon:yes gene_type:complete